MISCLISLLRFHRFDDQVLILQPSKLSIAYTCLHIWGTLSDELLGRFLILSTIDRVLIVMALKGLDCLNMKHPYISYASANKSSLNGKHVRKIVRQGAYVGSLYMHEPIIHCCQMSLLKR